VSRARLSMSVEWSTGGVHSLLGRRRGLGEVGHRESYRATKSASHVPHLGSSASHGLSLCILPPDGIYGPHHDHHRRPPLRSQPHVPLLSTPARLSSRLAYHEISATAARSVTAPTT
jgi:hypothetical protein